MVRCRPRTITSRGGSPGTSSTGSSPGSPASASASGDLGCWKSAAGHPGCHVVRRSNLLTLDGRDYLVAPRGHTQWVRNLRVAGVGVLYLGRRALPFTATEVPEAERADILRAYLRRWKAEVGVFFGGVSADSSDDELRRIAADHPVFVLAPGGTPRRGAPTPH